MSTDTTQWPKISIVTPSFNQGEFIQATIQSVLNQNYPNLEYIIIDGGSTDGSVNIIKKYKSQLTYWVSEPDKGQADAINKGLKKCTGDIIAWLNSDDLYAPGILFEVAEFFKYKLDEPIFLSGTCKYVDANGDIVWQPSKTDDSIEKADYEITHLLRCWKYNLVQPSTFWSRKAFEKMGYLDEKRHFALDLDYWLRAIEQNIPIYTIDKICSVFVYHDKSKSRVQQKILNKDLRFLSKKYLNGYTYFSYVVDYYLNRHSYMYLKFANSLVKTLPWASLKYLLKGFIHFPLSIVTRPLSYIFVFSYLLLGEKNYDSLKKKFK